MSTATLIGPDFGGKRKPPPDIFEHFAPAAGSYCLWYRGVEEDNIEPFTMQFGDFDSEESAEAYAENDLFREDKEYVILPVGESPIGTRPCPTSTPQP